MKRFFYSLGSKVLIFLALLLTSTVMILSLVSFLLLAFSGAYNASPDYVQEEAVGKLLLNPVRMETERYLWEGGEKSLGSVDVQIRNGDQVLFQTEGSDFSESDHRYSYLYTLFVYQNQKKPRDRYYRLFREGHVLDSYYAPEAEESEYVREQLDVTAKIRYSNRTIYSIGEGLVRSGCQYRFTLFGIFFVSLLLSVVLYVLWVAVSGKKADGDEIAETAVDRIPMDLYLVIIGFAGMIIFGVMIGIFDGMILDEPEIVIPLEIIGTMLLFLLFLFLSSTLAVRIRTGKLFRNTLIGMCIRMILRFSKWLFRSFTTLLEGIPLFPGAVAGIVGIGIFEILWTVLLIAGIISADNSDALWVLLFLLCGGKLMIYGILIPFYISKRYAMAKIIRYCKELAEGDFSPKSEEGLGMKGDLKKAGKDLNSVSEGMNLEMERRMKSERMKTELITNVSHDLKTPLTSIINYSDLIHRECEGGADPTVIREYSEVLTRQSGKLKRLIEDLVEVSKASSGVLEVEMSPCDGNVLLIQSEGEFEERFRDAGLEVVLQTFEEDLPMMADPRRMWRVFENLYGNICKFSLKGSRVYLTARKSGEHVQFLFRNISREALDISPEELMERFVRGDRSRNTEGNGLGLSIARSMTELQNGTMNIKIDGDFFKVVLDFPLSVPSAKPADEDSAGTGG